MSRNRKGNVIDYIEVRTFKEGGNKQGNKAVCVVLGEKRFETDRVSGQSGALTAELCPGSKLPAAERQVCSLRYPLLSSSDTAP